MAALVHEWRYAETIPLLERSLHEFTLTDYEQLVARVNLAAALVYQECFEEAHDLLNELIASTAKANARLLFGNSLELVCYNSILAGAWNDAEKYLKRAERALSQMDGVYPFFVRKCKALLFLFREGPTLNRLVKTSLENGNLTRDGEGAAVRYAIAKKVSS